MIPAIKNQCQACADEARLKFAVSAQHPFGLRALRCCIDHRCSLNIPEYCESTAQCVSLICKNLPGLIPDT
jgi:hypothetical protein